jgi:eukaryotic-like serine/threonine-protein kinase
VDLPSEEQKRSYSYRFGSAEFDEARFELRVSGLPVDVERKALEVLGCLLRHAGEVVTKEELLSEVWAGRITVEKVLPNAINKLRRALGESNAQCIATQARMGYRLDGTVVRTAVGKSPGSAQLQEAQLVQGKSVPGRDNFVLNAPLSQRSGSEVWLAQHRKTQEKRVYKFALTADALRALKREATLFRVLQESLVDQTQIVQIMDWNFEHEPYFLECEFAGQNLLEWAPTHLPAMPREQRVDLFLRIADAVEAAHAVGVLHKDLKPANILIAPAGADANTATSAQWCVRLTDFGSGRMLDPERLSALGITKLGMTENYGEDSSSGTPLYIAPEVFSGNTSTVQSDVFALGIILYQLLAGALSKPMVSGWEQDVLDPFLCADLAQATDGNPARRFAGVRAFSEQLRSRPERRMQAQLQIDAAAQSQSAQAALARSRAQRPYLIALISALVIGALGALWLLRLAVDARNQARAELARASAINRFLNEDLVGQSNPMVAAKGQNATVKDVLLAARDRVSVRFAAQPDAEAAIRTSLAQLFYTIDLWPESRAQARSALALFEQGGNASADQALKLRLGLIRTLCRTAQFDAAQAEIAKLQQFSSGKPANQRSYLNAAGWAIFYLTKSDFAQATPRYGAAITALKSFDPENTSERDALRVDQISALTALNQYPQAQAVGNGMIAEARARPEDTKLLVAMTELALARSYSHQGENARAIALLLSAQSVIVARLGPEHSRNLNLLNELFAIYFRMADWQKAIPYAAQIHQRVRAKMGDKHNMTYVTLANLGRAELESGDAANAGPHLREAYAFLAANMGAKAAQTQDAAVILAQAEIELGHFDAAQAVIATLDVPVLESFRGHGLWQFGVDGLQGLMLQGQGKRAQAEPLLRSAFAGLTPDGKDKQPDRFFLLLKKALQEYQTQAKTQTR